VTTASEFPVNCICCEGTNSTVHLPGLRRCETCSHVWAETTLSDDELRDLYGPGYFVAGEYENYELEERALKLNFSFRCRELLRHCPERGRIWEIGSAYGYFLQIASRHYDAAGCDISEHAVTHARTKLGLNVLLGDYLQLDLGAPVDAVCMWDTIEHLRRPDLHVRKAAADLRDGGVLAISTGDIGALAARIRGRRWRQLHPPTHLHYFTVNSLRALLERLGFEVLQMRHPAFWRSIDQILFRILAHPDTKRTAGLYRLLCRVPGRKFLSLAIPMNTFDLVTVYARMPLR